MPAVWKRCSSCKKEILCNSTYYVCSVSTCRQKATNYMFCSVPCWDAHIPVERHRGDDFAAIEKRAPSTPDAEVKRIVVGSSAAESGKTVSSSSMDDEILVVVSKVKKYIAERSGGMNTSASVMDVLTDRVKRICDRAIEEARANGRKTVMDRDIPT